MRRLEKMAMRQQFFPRIGNSIDKLASIAETDDAAAVYPDHEIVTRHFDGPLTVGDFVSAFADGADVHGGLPTSLRITLHEDAARTRELMASALAQRGG
jgi:hypothetical protein